MVSAMVSAMVVITKMVINNNEVMGGAFTVYSTRSGKPRR